MFSRLVVERYNTLCTAHKHWSSIYGSATAPSRCGLAFLLATLLTSAPSQATDFAVLPRVPYPLSLTILKPALAVRAVADYISDGATAQGTESSSIQTRELNHLLQRVRATF